MFPSAFGGSKDGIISEIKPGMTWFEDSGLDGLSRHIPTSAYTDALITDDQEALDKIEWKSIKLTKSGLLPISNSTPLEKLKPGTQVYHSSLQCYAKLDKFQGKPK